MKIQVVSDLHLEFFKDARFTGIAPASDADVLVIAGDIEIGTYAVKRFAKWPVPVVYVHGNHELYGRDYSAAVKELRSACAGTQIHFLEQDALVLDGFPDVRIFGTCLWTDYLLFGRPLQAACMAECERFMPDHSRIRSDGRFTPKDAMYRHVRAKRWLAAQLDEPFDGKTVVVTHHGCHWGSVAPRWRNSPLSAGFASDLTPLVVLADLWIHGHTHHSFDYRVGRARVVVNPRGYPTTTGFENTDFKDQMVVEP